VSGGKQWLIKMKLTLLRPPIILFAEPIMDCCSWSYKYNNTTSKTQYERPFPNQTAHQGMRRRLLASTVVTNNGRSSRAPSAVSESKVALAWTSAALLAAILEKKSPPSFEALAPVSFETAAPSR
jgi:hypothetical protein